MNKRNIRTLFWKVVIPITAGVCVGVILHYMYTPPKERPTASSHDPRIDDQRKIPSLPVPSLVVHYDNTDTASDAKRIADALDRTATVTVTIEGPTGGQATLGGAPVEVSFSYKDATRKDLADQLWRVVTLQYPKARRTVDSTLSSDYEVRLKRPRQE